MSNSIINSVLDPANSSNLYSVSGCPGELFKYMHQLAIYAREFELVLHMTCATFDMGPVLVVEKAIQQWRPPHHQLSQDIDDDVLIDTATSEFALGSFPGANRDLDPIEAAHHVQDLYHCAQAWRFALLVYIERVFKCRRREELGSRTRLSLFARKALNNVSSCRRGTMLQKQLLLPVFLAGCETQDETLRDEARGYCRWWAAQTRYEMFMTSLGLLEEVWAASANDAGCWWGSLIDQKSGSGSRSTEVIIFEQIQLGTLGNDFQSACF